ncbi:MAG: CAP domain-containing protein [Candidatus Liptonbacteria bacterium]
MILRAFLESFADVFSPSERNGQVPYILSWIGTSVAFIAALVLILAPTYLRITDLASLTQPVTFSKNEMVALTNTARSAAGLPTLSVNPTLEQAAETKATDMFAYDYFAHTSPAGKTPWQILKNIGYRYSAAGENLAVDYASALDVQNALMNSPTHRANILSPLFTEIGIAVEQGMLQGHPSIVVAEYFGSPAPTKTSTTSTASPTSTTGARTGAKPNATSTKPMPTSTIIHSTTTVSTLNITGRPSSSVPEVLGTSQAAPQNILEKIKSVAAKMPQSAKIKILALAFMVLIIISLAFVLVRAGSVPITMAARAIVILALLGYAALSNTNDLRHAMITPSSATSESSLSQ